MKLFHECFHLFKRKNVLSRKKNQTSVIKGTLSISQSYLWFWNVCDLSTPCSVTLFSCQLSCISYPLQAFNMKYTSFWHWILVFSFRFPYLYFFPIHLGIWLTQVTTIFRSKALYNYFTLPIIGFTEYHSFATHFPWKVSTRHYVKSVDIPNILLFSCLIFFIFKFGFLSFPLLFSSLFLPFPALSFMALTFLMPKCLDRTDMWTLGGAIHFYR